MKLVEANSGFKVEGEVEEHQAGVLAPGRTDSREEEHQEGVMTLGRTDSKGEIETPLPDPGLADAYDIYSISSSSVSSGSPLPDINRKNSISSIEADDIIGAQKVLPAAPIVNVPIYQALPPQNVCFV
jgi:hypothetical protein